MFFLHAGLTKEFSALLIQLRTGIIGFNDFLFRRRVPTVSSPRCACDTAAMTVHHVLLDCPTWAEPRKELLGVFRTKDLRILLNDRKGALAAIKFILHTDILAQFRRIAKQKLVKHINYHQQSENISNHNLISDWEENVLMYIPESNNSQFDSEDASTSQADHRQPAGFKSS